MSDASPACDLSILIISYNTRELTLDCLHSVFEQTHAPTFELLVVDNASQDGSAEAIAAAFPQVRLFALDQNLGFAAANNFAAEHARGRWVLLLNPDTVVLDRAIERLLAFAEAHPEAGIFGGRTLYADRSLNPSSCWGRPTPWSVFCQALGLNRIFSGSTLFNPEALPGWQRDTVREVDIVTGCFFLLRRSLWDQLAGFDPRFFMYGEEADLCLRARATGVRCLICPEATIVHYDGASDTVRADRQVRMLLARTRLFRKHWRATAAAFGVAMLKARVWGRALASRFARPAERAVWLEIWRRRTEWQRG